MRILVIDSDTAAKAIGLYLTRAEAIQLAAYLEDLLDAADPAGAHAHLTDPDFVREVTVALYDPADVSGFDRRSRELIENDK